MSDSDITASTAWRNLLDHHREIAGTTLRELFAADPDRATRFSTEADGLTLDWSKTLIDETARDLAEKFDGYGRALAVVNDRMARAAPGSSASPFPAALSGPPSAPG